MNILYTIIFIVFFTFQVILLIYLLLPTLLLIIYGIKRALGISASPMKGASENQRQYSFAAIVTAHRNLDLVPPLVDSLLKQTYRNFKVYVVADACEEKTIEFEDPNVIVLYPETPLNAKIKSIDYAMNNFVEQHDALIIFDADNLAHPDYLSVLNTYFNKGYKAVQTNMLPKNTDNIWARLDAAGNLYYNFIDRRMRMELGMSAHIWGLGIAIDTGLYKMVLYQNFLGGFDKKVQADIVRRVPVLAYAEEAIVYDEKIESGAALEKQRTRWLHAYFKYIEHSWAVLWTGLKTFNFNLVYFGCQLFRPPLLLQFAAAFVFFLVDLWLFPLWSLYWVMTVVAFVVTFVAVVAVMTKDKEIVKSLFRLPMFVTYQLRALLRIKRAGKTFLKTENNKVIYIDELLKNETIH